MNEILFYDKVEPIENIFLEKIYLKVFLFEYQEKMHEFIQRRIIHKNKLKTHSVSLVNSLQR